MTQCVPKLKIYTDGDVCTIQGTVVYRCISSDVAERKFEWVPYRAVLRDENSSSLSSLREVLKMYRNHDVDE